LNLSALPHNSDWVLQLETNPMSTAKLAMRKGKLIAPKAQSVERVLKYPLCAPGKTVRQRCV
jgi:hypothetical protein